MRCGRTVLRNSVLKSLLEIGRDGCPRAAHVAWAEEFFKISHLVHDLFFAKVFDTARPRAKAKAFLPLSLPSPGPVPTYVSSVSASSVHCALPPSVRGAQRERDCFEGDEVDGGCPAKRTSQRLAIQREAQVP